MILKMGIKLFLVFSHSCTVIHTSGKCILHSQKCHRLAPSCGFYQLAASCQEVAASLLTSSSSMQRVWDVCADLLQVYETTGNNHVDIQLPAIKPVDNLLPSSQSKQFEHLKYWCDGSKATSLQQTRCNLCVSGCVHTREYQ